MHPQQVGRREADNADGDQDEASDCTLLPSWQFLSRANWAAWQRPEPARFSLPFPTDQGGSIRKPVKLRGNVFLDLGFPAEEAAVLKMRSDLMPDLREFIRDNNLTQTEAAVRLGVSQSRVSDLVRGKWEKFSLEMLITLAARFGRRVEVRVVA